MSNTDNLIIRNVPVSSTIVELNDSSLAIIDTGMAGNRDLLDELDELGCAPGDFSLVLNTHLHTDHIGGNRLFTNARIIISRRELSFENYFAGIMQECDQPLETLRSMGRCVDHTTPQLAWDLKCLVQKYTATELVGDEEQIEYYEDEPDLPQSISWLSVPGHSVDSRVIMVQGRRRRAASVGDALFHRDLWRGTAMDGIHYDEKLFQRHAQRLARLPDIIIPGHDRVFDGLTGKYLKEDVFFI